MDMHGSTPQSGVLDRVTGHDAFLELVREKPSTFRTRVFFPEQERYQGCSQDYPGPTGGEKRASTWARLLVSANGLPTEATCTRSPSRGSVERGWIYHQHLISANEIQAHIENFEQFSKSAHPGWVSLG